MEAIARSPPTVRRIRQPGQGQEGTILYRIVWKDYPPDLVWFEPAENIGEQLLDDFEARATAEAAEDEAAAREDASSRSWRSRRQCLLPRV